MNAKIIKDYLSIINIYSIKQLEENDLDYWHQKRYIEIQRSSSNKKLVSDKLIELNTAKVCAMKCSKQFDVVGSQYE